MTEALSVLEQRAAEATRAGRTREAMAAWQAVLAVAPSHLTAWVQLGRAAWQTGDLAQAQAACERAAQGEPRNPQRWLNLAMVLERTGDDSALATALQQVLTLEPRELMALLMRGRLHERAGRRAEAAAAFNAAVAVAPPLDRVVADLRPALAHAIEFSERHQAALADHLDAGLRDVLSQCQGPGAERFKLSLDILLGRKRRYDPQPLLYYYPQLPATEFFDRSAFAWLDPIEAGTDLIRSELMTVLAQDTGFEPYLQYRPDEPLDQWAGLNRNPAWSAFHLVQRGLPVADNASRCPHTMDLWARHVPAPRQSGRTPVAMFSLLQPHTHIPAHTGASNVRLVVHLPLLVPPHCRFRVGNSLREWSPGRAWVFDDTIEHEAWNDSDHLRAVWIFDIWHPGLSEDERRLIEALNLALDGAGNGAPSGYSS